MKIQVPGSEGISSESKVVSWYTMGSCNLNWGLWKDSIEAGNFELSDSQEFSSPEEVVSPPSADVLTPPPDEILLSLPLTEEINFSLSAKPAVAFPVGNVNQDNSDVPQAH